MKDFKYLRGDNKVIRNLGQIIDSSRESLEKMAGENPFEEHYAIRISPPSKGTSASLVDMVGRLMDRDIGCNEFTRNLSYDPTVSTGVNTLVANVCPEDGELRVIFSRQS